MIRETALLALVLATNVQAEEPETPPPPPEIKKTVDAISGKWATDMALTLPGKTPLKFKATMDCQKIAGGAAVQCTVSAKIPGMGVLDETDIWAWEPETKTVHDMTINNWGEVHDHKGKWKDEHTVEFAHLATQEGKPLEEHETVIFHPPHQMEFKLTAKTPDGVTVFEGKARR